MESPKAQERLESIVPKTLAASESKPTQRRLAVWFSKMSNQLDLLLQAIDNPAGGNGIAKFLTEKLGINVEVLKQQNGSKPPPDKLVVERPTHKKTERSTEDKNRRNSAVYKSNHLAQGTTAKQFPKPDENKIKQSGHPYKKITIDGIEIEVATTRWSTLGLIACLFPPVGKNI